MQTLGQYLISLQSMTYDLDSLSTSTFNFEILLVNGLVFRFLIHNVEDYFASIKVAI